MSGSVSDVQSGESPGPHAPRRGIDRPITLLFTSHTPFLGGAELALVELVRCIVPTGNVSVHVALPRSGPLESLLREAGATTWVRRYSPWTVSAKSLTSPARRLRRAARSCLGAVQLALLIRRIKADVVITNTITIPSAALAATITRTPHIWYIHEFGVLDHGLRFDLGFNLSRRIIRAISSEIVVNSHSVRSELFGESSENQVRTLYYAIDTPPGCIGPPDSQPEFSAVLVGLKTPSKGQADAIRAIGLLRQRGIDMPLTLVGASAPGYDAVLRRLAQTLGVADLVECVDFTRDPFEHVARSQVALMCSRFEAFGRVTVEAMKLGTPVIAASSGGTMELVRDGFNGLTYTPGDIKGLADCLQRLRSNPGLRHQLGENARSWSTETFSAQKYADGFLQVVDRVLPAARKGR